MSGAVDRVVLDERQRLSESLVWRLSLAGRQDAPGDLALADAFAQVVLGHLRDRARTGRTARTYVVELDAGSGRFAHHVLARLVLRLEAAALGVPMTYVVTAADPAEVARARSHPRLAPHVAGGVLDFAVFDPRRPAPLVLAESGVALAPGRVEAPLVALGNRVLSELPCDCFRIASGALAAGMATLSVRPEVAERSVLELGELALELAEAPVTGPYFDEPSLDALLAGYREQLGDATFTLPTVALRCLEYLGSLGGGVLAVVADPAIVDERDLERRDEPELALAPRVSAHVNLHALGEYARRSGGRAYVAARRSQALEIAALAIGLPDEAPETACAFRDAVDEAAPAALATVASALEADSAELDGDPAAPPGRAPALGELLAHLALVRWDPRVFLRRAAALARLAPTADPGERRDLSAALEAVWEAAFVPGDDAENLTLAIATVQLALGDHEQARWYLDHSIRLGGPRPAARFQLAVCHHALGDAAQARAELDALIAAEPAFAPAIELRALLDEETSGEPSPGERTP